MASGWNYIWGESWKEYIQRSTITGDLERAQQQSTREMVGAISGHTASILTGMNLMGGQLSSSMDRGFAQVGSSINQLGNAVGAGFDQLGATMSDGFGQLGSAMYDGFAQLGGQMDQIAGEIAGLNASFQWGFGQMIAQMGGMNDSLNTLIKLAREEVQRLAYNHFEIARDAFRRQLYEDCLEELGKAISGDHVSSGYKLEWRFHQMQGVIRLGYFGCEPSLVDPAQAEQSFLLAAKYARADFPEEAAKAYLSAGWAAFVQGKLPEALKYTDQAVSADSDLTEAVFQAAKFRMADGRPGDALPLLRTAIDAAPAYVVKASADGDFQRHQDELDGFLEAMRQEQLKALAPKVRGWLSEAEGWATTVAEVEACTDELGRWRSLLEGKWGLLNLLKYADEGAKQDHLAIVRAHDAGLKRLEGERIAAEAAAAAVKEAARKELERKRNTSRIETRAVKVEKPVDEAYQVQEQYEENEPYDVEEQYQDLVVIRPAGLFRREEVGHVTRTRTVTRNRKVTKTRTVTRHREVVRQVEVETLARVNLLDEVVSVFPEEHFKFVRIPAGKFRMGSPEKLHTVTLTKPFELMTTPVTQALWEFVMGGNPSCFKGPDRPVEEVSWDDAQGFISKLNAMLGVNSFRLPTEAEWEYACRAGTTSAMYGNLDKVAWHENNSGNETHSVGQKQPNAWGLYDMLGNVWEWCQDWYGGYPDGEVIDPVGSSSGSVRVNRGGSWISDARDVHAANRNYVAPGSRSNRLGFRLARSLS